MKPLFLMLAAAALAAAGGPVKVARGAYPDIAVDRAGGVHLVYARDGRLYYRKRTKGVWGEEQDTGAPAGNASRSDPEVAVDSKGRPHVFSGTTYGYHDGRRWRAVEPGVTRDTALAIDSKDNVYLVRRGGHGAGYVGLLKRRAGAAGFAPMPDPDTANRLPKGGPSDHCYAHVFIGPKDDSVHVVYRHGAPTRVAYRVSEDGGLNWAGAGVSDDRSEAPSGAAAPDGAVYVATGNGTVFRRSAAAPYGWAEMGRGIAASPRDLPALAADGEGNLYIAGFGGRYNVWSKGQWMGERRLDGLSGKKLGFAEVAGAGDYAYAVYEEGDEVNHEQPAGVSDILFAVLRPEAARVPRYGRFEVPVRNPRRYADPYGDVALNVVYTRPDKTTVPFWGFHDGGDVWKLRFMPDQAGVWTYEAAFSDASPGARGSFECVASDLPGMISADRRNPMWFGYSSGRQALVRGLHVGDRFFAANWPAGKRTQFLDWAGANGYNLLSIASHYLNRDAPGRGQGWETPRLWPLDAGEYRRMEAVLDDLERRRMLVFPFAGFFGQRSNYPRDPLQQERYIRYTLARLAPYWNVMFNVAGPEPNLKERWMEDEEVERLGRLIKRLDPFGHLLAVHNRTGDDPYRDADWTNYGVLQGPKTADPAVLSRGLLESHHPAKPLLAQETLWSGNKYHLANRGGYSDDELRKNAWVIQMSAATLVFADNDGDSSSGFTGTMELDARKQHRHDIVRRVWDFMETVSFREMRPRQDLVDRGYCLAEPGRRYLVYLPEGGAVNVKAEGGPFRVEWINGRNTAERQAAGSSADGRGLTAPGAGDWVLQLSR
jgi:hypothetical protein